MSAVVLVAISIVRNYLSLGNILGIDPLTLLICCARMSSKSIAYFPHVYGPRLAHIGKIYCILVIGNSSRSKNIKDWRIKLEVLNTSTETNIPVRTELLSFVWLLYNIVLCLDKWGCWSEKMRDEINRRQEFSESSLQLRWSDILCIKNLR